MCSKWLCVVFVSVCECVCGGIVCAAGGFVVGVCACVCGLCVCVGGK